MKMCHSCGMPLTEETKSLNDNFCKHCTDEKGNVKSRDEIKIGVAWWLRTWQGDIGEKESLNRADHYLKAMPHWADKD